MADQFGEGLIRLLPNLRRFAISLCRSRDIADDLVQQTCQKALSNRDSFDPETRMDAWLFRILRNTWIDMTRRTRTEGNKVDIDDAPELAIADRETTAENRLMLQRTFAEIDLLPVEQREVLLLVCVEEFSYKQAAEVLELPIGTVMSRLARARQRLALQLGINGDPKRSEDRKRATP